MIVYSVYMYNVYESHLHILVYSHSITVFWQVTCGDGCGCLKKWCTYIHSYLSPAKRWCVPIYQLRSACSTWPRLRERLPIHMMPLTLLCESACNYSELYIHVHTVCGGKDPMSPSSIQSLGEWDDRCTFALRMHFTVHWKSGLFYSPT